MRPFVLLLAACTLAASALADSISLKGGVTIDECTVLQDLPDHVAILYGTGILRIERAEIESIKKETTTAAAAATTNHLPDYRSIVLKLSAEAWAGDLQQIPATVVSVGVLRNVPYKSHKAGENYEINVYGDPSAPAGFEIGVKGGLLNDEKARAHCVDFVCSLLKNEADRNAVKALKTAKDLVTVNGITYEITPATDPDAYGGWWVSIYSETALNSVRASDKELAAITVAKTAIATPPPHTGPVPANTADTEAQRRAEWTARDLTHARTVRAVPNQPVDERVYVRGFTRHEGAYVPHHRTVVIRR